MLVDKERGTDKLASIHEMNRLTSEDFCPYTYDEVEAENERFSRTKVSGQYGGPKYNFGLWLVPSYFNHSCIPNCQWVFFGDTMFIYANKDIDTGTELFIQFHWEANLLTMYDARTKILKERKIKLWVSKILN